MTFWIKPTAETVMRSLRLRKDEGGVRLSAMALAAVLVVLVFVGTESARAPGATTRSTTIAFDP